MKTQIAIFTLLCCSLLSLTSSDFTEETSENPPEEKMVMVAEDFFADPNLVKSHKTKVIQRVFGKLKMAKGEFRTAKPTLHFVRQIPNNGRIAVAYPSVGLVYFEEKMYDVCVSVGKDSLNAIAAVLAHELTHCYERHTWEDNFKRDFKQTQMDTVLRDRYMDDEIQADYLGGFLSYAAGFQPYGIMGRLYEKEYKAYNLTDEALDGSYPPMQERIQIAERSQEKLDSLIQYFEMANWLVGLKEYEDASDYFNAVEGVFQSREIYNNLGVVAFLTALEAFDSREMAYAFPIELDAQSRLGGNGKKGSEDDIRVLKLQEAMEYFEKAKSMDAFYPIAWLNLGCAQALYGLLQEDFGDLDYDEAEISAKRAIRLAKGEDPGKWKKTISDAYTLLGIIEALRNDAEIRPLLTNIEKMRIDNQTEGLDAQIEKLKQAADGAVIHFNKSLQLDEKAPLAKINKEILQGQAPAAHMKKGDSGDAKEQIENKKIAELAVGREHIYSTLYLGEGALFAVVKFPQSRLFLHNLSNGDESRTVSFYLTDQQYRETTARGVKIGDDYEEVIQKYPNPPVPLGLGQGYFLAYSNPKIVFRFNEDHELIRWGIYNRQF